MSVAISGQPQHATRSWIKKQSGQPKRAADIGMLKNKINRAKSLLVEKDICRACIYFEFVKYPGGRDRSKCDCDDDHKTVDPNAQGCKRYFYDGPLRG